MEGAHCYNPATGCDDGSLTLPILEYDHGQGCSVTGGFRYRGTAIPGLYGTYLYGDYCTGRIWRGIQAGDGSWSATQLLDSTYNISGWGEDAAGELYLAEHNGSVYELTPTPNPSPAASGLVPSAVIAGDPDFELAVDGTGFVYGSVVRWNGSDRPTTFVSSGRVTAAIPAADILAAGSALVTVFSPAPGGGTSAAQTLNINPTFLDVPTTLLRLRLHPGRLRRRRHQRMRCPDLLSGEHDDPRPDGGLPAQSLGWLDLRSAALLGVPSSPTCPARAESSTRGSRIWPAGGSRAAAGEATTARPAP